MYSALELARAAGFLVRPVRAGGVLAIEDDVQRVLEVGPDAREVDIVAHAQRFLVFPAAAKIVAPRAKCAAG